MKKSYGEKLIEELLRETGIPFIKQFAPIPGSGRRYDFCFYNRRLERYYLLEWDGKQHFKRSRRFHKTKKAFLDQQTRDREKTFWATQNNYYIIRIDCTCLNVIPQMLLQAVLSNCRIWFSNKELYRYLT